MKYGPKLRVADVATHERSQARLLDEAEYELWSIPSFQEQKPERVLGLDIQSGKFLLEPGDVLLGKINPRINRVWVVTAANESAIQVGSTEWIVLRPRHGTLDSHYLTYCLQSPNFREVFIASVTGATGSHSRGNPEIALNYLIPLPPLDEQKRIVAKLDQAQSQLDRLASKLDLQLGAVDGLERAALNQEIAVSRVEQGNTCSASELAVSGWPLVQLAEVAKIDRQTGKHSGLRYVGLEDIQSGTGRLSATVQPRTVKSQTFRFGSEHVLYGRLRPYLNKFALPTFAGHCSTEIFPLLPSPRLSREFLAYWLSSSRICNEINETCHGARMPRADMDEVLTFEIPLPPLDEQKRIVAKLDAVQQELAALRERLYERRSLALSFRDRTLAAALVGDL